MAAESTKQRLAIHIQSQEMDCCRADTPNKTAKEVKWLVSELNSAMSVILFVWVELRYQSSSRVENIREVLFETTLMRRLFGIAETVPRLIAGAFI